MNRAIKTGIAPPRGTKVDVAALTEQAKELQRGLTGLTSRLRRVQGAEPGADLSHPRADDLGWDATATTTAAASDHSRGTSSRCPRQR